MASKIKDRIVASAMRCFASKGFHGCSTKEISERANVTEGSLFRVFGSKEKLFSEALSTALSRKKMKRDQSRIVIFALLEGRLLEPEQLKAIRKASAQCPAIYSVLKLTGK